MTKYGSADVAFLLVGGYDILGSQTDLRVKTSRALEPTHVLGDSWEKSDLPGGGRRAEAEQKGFYDDAADGNNVALCEANVGTARVMCVGFEGNTIGCNFCGFSGAMQADYNRIASRGAFHKAEAMHQGSGIVEEGVILHTHSTETGASGNTQTTPHDNGAASANGGSGYLEVSALTLGGYTNVVMKVRHSVDNTTYIDLITFTAATAAPTAERKTVAGTVERYTATSYAFTGAGAGQSVKFMAGFRRN